MPGTSDLRCSEVARREEYRPAGTAASSPVYLLVELPLPWPADIAEHPLLQSVRQLAGEHGARLQALVPTGDDPDSSRVVVYRRPVGPFQAYARTERQGSLDDLPAMIVAALDEAARSDHEAVDDDPLMDVLVCTHGTRDVCCGRNGIGVHRDLLALDLPGVRVWRTSHTGGHRFAPTAVTFPDGRAWAWVDAPTLVGLVRRTLDPRLAARHDRGCVAFPDPFTQAAEAAVLAVEGWSWLARRRSVEVSGRSANGDDVRWVTVTGDPTADTATGASTSAESAGAGRSAGGSGSGIVGCGGMASDSDAGESAGTDGTVGVVGHEPVIYRAEVGVSRIVPVPDCGRPLEEARKSSPDLQVRSLQRARAAPPSPRQ
jgi:hypothetical protein